MTAKQVLIPMLLVAIACGPISSPPPESRVVVDEYLEFVKQGKVKDAKSLYMAEAFKTVSVDEWLTMLDRAHAKLGAFKSYTVSLINSSTVTGTSHSGVYTTYQCNVQFGKHEANRLGGAG